MGVKLAIFPLILAAVPAAAQFNYGHKLGTTVAYLEEPGNTREGSPVGVSLGNRSGQVVVTIRGTDGRLTQIFQSDSPALISNLPLTNKTPCAIFEAWAEQVSTDYTESLQAGVLGVDRTEGKAVIHRFVRDDLRQIYASYTLTLEQLRDAGTYRVSFGPPTGDLPDQVRGKAGWKLVSPARYPVSQIVRDEDAIRLELYSNEAATRRLVDYIHAGGKDHMVFRKESPHDYYAEDAELALTQPRLRINGVAGGVVTMMPESIRGAVLWVYIPGHGRYVLSPHAHAELGSESAGEAAGNSLTFTSPDGNIFRIETAERVAAGSGSYTIHVLPDPGWEPADPGDRTHVMIGAAPGIVGAVEAGAGQ